jgi:hypothetical protein
MKSEFDVWKSKPPFEDKKKFMKKYKSLEKIHNSYCLQKVFNAIQAKLNQHFLAANILNSGKFNSKACASAQAISILAIGASVLPLGGTVSSFAEYISYEVGNVRRVKRYEHFNQLIPSNTPTEAADVFEDIATGIVLTDQQNIELANVKRLKAEKISEVCQELRSNDMKLFFKRTAEIDIDSYAEYLSLRAKENILNGNLNRSRIEKSTKEEENLSLENMIENIIMHTAKTPNVIRYVLISMPNSQLEISSYDGDQNRLALQQKVIELEEKLKSVEAKVELLQREHKYQLDECRKQLEEQKSENKRNIEELKQFIFSKR